MAFANPYRKGILLPVERERVCIPSRAPVSKNFFLLRQAPVLLSLVLVMLAGIRDILLISTPEHLSQYELLLADGGEWGNLDSVRRAGASRGVGQRPS